VTFRSRALPAFWERYEALPGHIQKQAEKQFALFKEDSLHRSLRLKRVGEFWSVRVTQGYRALAVREGDEFTWFWIGSHDEYERLLQG
jgi:hypothetical protein